MVHVLVLLATSEGPLSSSWIAGSVNTNPVVIRQIVGQLREAGLVETVAGSAGGALLKKDAARITLGDIYGLVKAETLFGLHPSEPNPLCPVGRNIQKVLIEVFEQVDGLIADALSRLSIADISSRVLQREAARQDESS